LTGVSSTLDRQEALDNTKPVEVPIEIEDEVPLYSESGLGELKLEEFEAILRHRRWWSYSLLVMVGLITVFDLVLILLTGSHVLSFSSDFAIPTIIGATLLEVYGLCRLVIKFFFDHSYEPND